MPKATNDHRPEFKLAGEAIPEADLPIAADWMEERGLTVAAKILRTWRGLEGATSCPHIPLHTHVNFGLTDAGFVFMGDGMAKRKWVRGGHKTVPLICVGTMQWRKYEPGIYTGGNRGGATNAAAFEMARILTGATTWSGATTFAEDCRQIMEAVSQNFEARTGLMPVVNPAMHVGIANATKTDTQRALENLGASSAQDEHLKTP